MKDIVIEIDGVRHKSVEAIDKSACCSTCSLQEFCGEVWEQSMDCNICGSLMINNSYHFELDKKKK